MVPLLVRRELRHPAEQLPVLEDVGLNRCRELMLSDHAVAQGARVEERGRDARCAVHHVALAPQRGEVRVHPLEVVGQ